MPKIKTGGGFHEEQWRVQDSLLYRGIRRTTRNKLIVLFMLLLIICVVLIYPLAVKYKLKYDKPAVITAGELLAITDMSKQPRLPFSATFENSNEYKGNPSLKRIAYFKSDTAMLSITGESVTDAKIKSAENAMPGLTGSTAGGKAYSEYVLLKIGGKYLLTKRVIGTDGLAYKGTLTYLPGDLLSVAVKSSGVNASQLIPAIFDASGEIFASLKIDTIFCSVFFFIWFISFIIVVRRVFNPTLHDAYKQMYVYAGPVEDNIKDLDREIADPGCYSTLRKTITPNWTITNTMFNFMIKRKDR